ncbi:uncharacterized protein LOC134666910 [Cydia fagiglandana]|uniref:uncharacterized protein LOC134666910 n=1 Tax=Cydia fagiglandana TaxID=1458189 RepID=UPI002FEE32A1
MIFTVRTRCYQLSEYLSYDILDEKLIRLFQPYRDVQKILGSCRMDIKDRFVTPPTLLQKFYTIICMTMTIIIFTNYFLQTYSTIFYSEHEMASLRTSGICGILGVFSLSILHARFFNNESNVQLYVKMQEIDRIMNIHPLVKTTVLVVLCVRSELLVREADKTKKLTISVLSRHSDGNFRTKAKKILKLLKESPPCFSVYGMWHLDARLLLNLFNIISTFLDLESSATDIYLNEIFSTFNCFQNQYRFQRLNPSNNFQSALILDFLITATMTALNICMLLLLSIRSEMFLREVNKTKKLSNSILSRYLDGPLRRKAKKMLKIIERDTPRFCVYNMWCMDARLLLNIFAIITNAFVIILQFSFT